MQCQHVYVCINRIHPEGVEEDQRGHGRCTGPLYTLHCCIHLHCCAPETNRPPFCRRFVIMSKGGYDGSDGFSAEVRCILRRMNYCILRRIYAFFLFFIVPVVLCSLSASKTSSATMTWKQTWGHGSKKLALRLGMISKNHSNLGSSFASMTSAHRDTDVFVTPKLFCNNRRACAFVGSWTSWRKKQSKRFIRQACHPRSGWVWVFSRFRVACVIVTRTMNHMKENINNFLNGCRKFHVAEHRFVWQMHPPFLIQVNALGLSLNRFLWKMHSHTA